MSVSDLDGLALVADLLRADTSIMNANARIPSRLQERRCARRLSAREDLLHDLLGFGRDAIMGKKMASGEETTTTYNSRSPDYATIAALATVLAGVRCCSS